MLLSSNAENSKDLKWDWPECASSPGLGVAVAIKHERVKSTAGYADGIIQAEK